MSVVVTYLVKGMTCDHCVHAVAGELSALPGVSSVDVALASEGPSQVTVTSEAALDRATVFAAIDEAGYELAGV
jgi:copper chaperone